MADNILLENSDDLLLESGSQLLLESDPGSSPIALSKILYFIVGNAGFNIWYYMTSFTAPVAGSASSGQYRRGRRR